MEWYNKVNYANKTDLIYLIGIKHDLKENKEDISIKLDKAQKFSDLYNIKFFIISDKDNKDIKIFIDDIIKTFEKEINKLNNNNKTNQKEIIKKKGFKEGLL